LGDFFVAAKRRKKRKWEFRGAEAGGGTAKGLENDEGQVHKYSGIEIFGVGRRGVEAAKKRGGLRNKTQSVSNKQSKNRHKP